jgi:hypothetical protein
MTNKTDSPRCPRAEYGILGVRTTLDFERMFQLAAPGHTIKLMDTYIPNPPRKFRKALRKAVSKGVRIQVLLSLPGSAFARQRARECGDEYAQQGHFTHGILTFAKQLLEADPDGASVCIKFYANYAAQPQYLATHGDEAYLALTSIFLGTASRHSPHLEWQRDIATRSTFLDDFHAYFQEHWNDPAHYTIANRYQLGRLAEYLNFPALLECDQDRLKKLSTLLSGEKSLGCEELLELRQMLFQYIPELKSIQSPRPINAPDNWARVGRQGEDGMISGTFAFLSVDVVGSTDMQRSYGERAMQHAMSQVHNAVVKRAAMGFAYEGLEIRWNHDGGMYAFSGPMRATDSIEAAELMLHFLTTLNKTRVFYEIDCDIEVRIVLHAGDGRFDPMIGPGAMVSDEINFLFNHEGELGEKQAITLTDEAHKGLPPRWKKRLDRVGEQSKVELSSGQKVQVHRISNGQWE